MALDTYSELRPAPIRATISLVQGRIDAQFPSSGLSRLAAELLQVSERNQTVITYLRKPLWWLRGLTAMAIAIVIVLVLWAAMHVVRLAAGGVGNVAELLQGVDAASNELILLSLAILFLATLEIRLKRRASLPMLHRLRSIAHVVDMHQLMKDMNYLNRPVSSADAAGPLSRERLAIYLDYCTDLLALISKLAALHAQHLQDPVVLGAVNEVESLSDGLSRKIWQKITVLDARPPPTAQGVTGMPLSST